MTIILAIWTVTVCSPVQANQTQLITTGNSAQVAPMQIGPFANVDRDGIDRSKWGTRAYYDSSTPQITKSKAHRSRIVDLGQDLRIGANPQVPGGISDKNYKLGADEEWFTITVTIQVITLDYNARAYIGEIHKGEVVLRDKKTGMIKAIAHCGNWARQIGAIFTLVTCPDNNDQPNPCDDPLNMNAEMHLISTSEPRTLEDGSTSITETWGNECKTQLKEIITKQGQGKPCVPEGNTRLDEFHVQKAIDPFEFINKSVKLTEGQKSAVKGLIMLPEKVKKITDLIIYFNGCGYSVFAFSVEPGGLGWWKWIIPAIAVAAFLAGYYFPRGGSKITAIKTQDPNTGTISRPKIPF